MDEQMLDKKRKYNDKDIIEPARVIEERKKIGIQDDMEDLASGISNLVSRIPYLSSRISNHEWNKVHLLALRACIDGW